MKIIEENYDDFPCAEVLVLPSYNKSSKRMSFSSRKGKTTQSIFAYASLMIDTIGDFYGCRILELNNKDALYNERFYSLIETTAQIWVDDNNKQFNSLWFSVEDIDEKKAQEILNNIEGMQYNETYGIYIKQIYHITNNAPE